MIITIPGKPVPKGRPRFNRTRTAIYTPPETVEYEERVAWAVRAAGASFGKEKVCVLAQFHYAGKRLKDTDNMLKSALDGAEKGGLFENDSQAVFQSAIGYPESDDPRTILDVRYWPQKGHMIYCQGVATRVVDGVCLSCNQPFTVVT